MENNVSVMSIIFISIAFLLGILIPAGLFVTLRKKYQCSTAAFFIGSAVMAVFAFLLERLLHQAVLTSAAGTIIQNNIWLYGIYGGFAAGLFEESGRFLAFRFVLKKKQDNNYNALMYGAGHGGIEILVLLSLTMLNNLVYAAMINTGTMHEVLSNLSGTQLETMESIIEQLTQASPLLFLLSPIERIAAMILQISLSVLVWFAAKNKKHSMLLPLAFVLHMLIDSVTGIISKAGWNIFAVEIWIYLTAAGTVWIAVHIWKKQNREIMK